MIVLGIDPGTASLGYGIVERTAGRLREVVHGCLTTSPDLSLPERLLAIHALVDELISLHQPDLLGIERLFFSRNVQTAFAVGQARGVVLLAAARAIRPSEDTNRSPAVDLGVDIRRGAGAVLGTRPPTHVVRCRATRHGSIDRTGALARLDHECAGTSDDRGVGDGVTTFR